jgi:predicted dehydrogenase
MTSAPLRIAQVGVGNFGAYRRARLRETGLFTLIAAYDHNPEALAQCRQEDGAAPADSYEAMLETPGLEAVIISTGAKYHAQQIIAAVERGLHVFVEKPLCSTPEEVEQLLAVQRATGRVIGVGHTDHSHDAVARTTQHLLAHGELGVVAAVEATTAHSGGLFIQPGDWRGDPQKNPGGMLFQCGVHKIHELQFLFGPIVRVSAMMRGDVHATGTADVALCLLEFASGLVGTLHAYHVTPYYHTLHIFGTAATLYRESRFFDEGTTLRLQREHLDGKAQPREVVTVTGENDVCGNLRSFYRAIREGGEASPSLRDGAAAVNVVFAAEESARTGGAVEVRPVLEERAVY